MSRGDIFRKSYSIPVPDNAERLTVKGVASARFKRGGKTITVPLVRGRADRVLVPSPCYYGTVDGKPVKLFEDAVASRQRLAELRRKSERQESGVADPFEFHRRRGLDEHIADWRAAMQNEGAGVKHANQFAACVRRIVADCSFDVIADISASRVQQFLADMRKEQPSATLDPTKELYTRAELARLLDVKLCSVTSLIKRHRLDVIGEGKQRRYPKVTAEALLAGRCRGASVRTSNLYLAAVKAFCGWLVADRRAASSALEHLSGGNVERDRRRERRILDEGELRRVMDEARKSAVTFRGLAGVDREMLYLTACVTGYRAGELAALCPKDFDLSESPTVTLAGACTKNGKAASQPIPPDVAERLRSYLAGRVVDSPVWPGTWHERAADMLRIDLDAAGIPYAVEGADGLHYADFHAALRHSYVRLLDKAGATLKEAMQLARHSDPKLTMKVYGKARQSDLAGVVGRLPMMATPVESEPALAERLPFACRSDDVACGNMAEREDVYTETVQRVNESQLESGNRFDELCVTLTRDEEIASCRARTYDPLIKSQLLYQLS
jgi:integrase